MRSSKRSTSTNSRCPSESGPHLTLVDRSLWAKFDAIENEMIVTQIGRCIFPHLKLKATNLDPDSLYAIAVQIEQMDSRKHRYSNSGRWQVDDRQIKGPAAVYDPHWYYHPGSYSNGKTLMSDVISFENIRISNKTPDSKTSKSSNSHLFLVSSFRKYRPRIRLLQYSQHDRSKSIGSWSFTFEETSFFAITHYQNGAVNRLKTDHNPHAKGFRLNNRKPKSKNRGKRRSKGDTDEEQDTSENETRPALVRKKGREALPENPAAQRVMKSSPVSTKRLAKRFKSETEEEPEGDDESNDKDTEDEIRQDSEYFLGHGNTEESDTYDEGPPLATRAGTTTTRNSTETSSSRAPETSREAGPSDNRAGTLTRSKNQSRVSVQPQDIISENLEGEESEVGESEELDLLNKRDTSSVVRLKAQLTNASDDHFPSSDSPLDLLNSPTLSPCPSDLEDSLENGTEKTSEEESGDVEDDNLSDDGHWRGKKERNTSSHPTVQPRTLGDASFRIGSSNGAQGYIQISERTEGSSRSISKNTLESQNRNLVYQSTETYRDYGQYHSYSSWNGYGYRVAPSTTIPYSHMIEGIGNCNQVYTSDSSSLTLKRRRRGAAVPESNIIYAREASLAISDQATSTYELHGDMYSHVLLPAPVTMPGTLLPHPESVLYAPSMEHSHLQEIEPVAGTTVLISPARLHTSIQSSSPPHASVTWYQQFFVWDQPSPPVPNDDIPGPSAAAQPPVASSTPAQLPPIASSASRTRARQGLEVTEASDTNTNNVEPAVSDGPSGVTTDFIRQPLVMLTTFPALAPSTSVGPDGPAGPLHEEVQEMLICNELEGSQKSPKIKHLWECSLEESCQSEANHPWYSSNGLTESLFKDDMGILLRQVPQTQESVTERHGIVVRRRFYGGRRG
ncbi:T-box transcription factor tbx22 [Podila clonocystis]|nr:T-box transcription factor tbx22 [Podila clonocystis]